MADHRGAQPQRATVGRALRVIALGVRQQPLPFALAVLGSALYGAMTAMTAWAIGWATRTQVTPAVEAGEVTASAVWAILLVVGGVVAATTVGVLLRRIAGSITMYGVSAHYRRRVTRQYLRLPLSWHHRHPSGQLLSNANADVESTWMVFMPLPMAIGVLVMLAFGVVQMVLVDPFMALIGGLIFPMLMLVNTIYQRRMSPLATRAQRLRADVSAVAHESFEAALVVKAMGAEDREDARFSRVVGDLRQANVAVGRARGAFDPVVEAIPQIGALLVLAVGTQRVASGAMDASEVVQVAYLIALLAFPVRSIGWVLGEIPRTVVAWDRVEAVLKAGGAMTYGDENLPGDGPLQVVARGVGYRYDSAPPGDLVGGPPAGEEQEAEVRQRADALVDVDLDIPAGHTVAIVGPTGSGKSTLAQVLTRLVDPTSGRVELDGHEATRLAAGVVPAQVALVPQQTFLFDDTVRANVTLGEEVSDTAVWEALSAARADQFVAALPAGLDTEVGERGATLSGGQRQRLALARALVRHPRLLVLDDATSAVDPEVELDILSALDAARPPDAVDGDTTSAGVTIVLIAYRMSTIALAQTVIHLEAGRVVDVGSHAELLSRDPGYRHLVTAYARAAQEREGRTGVSS